MLGDTFIGDGFFGSGGFTGGFAVVVLVATLLVSSAASDESGFSGGDVEGSGFRPLEGTLDSKASLPNNISEGDFTDLPIGDFGSSNRSDVLFEDSPQNCARLTMDF